MASRHPREPFWYALTDRHRLELRRIGSRRDYRSEAVIVREREPTDFALVLLDGCIKVSTNGLRGGQAILGIRDAGDLVGEQAGMDGGSRSATLSALTPIEALILPAVPFRAFLRASPDAAELMQRVVSGRLREADQYRAAVAFRTVPQRLAALLLHLGQRYGTRVDDGILIELPLSQEDLAGLVLTSQRTLGRVLEQWRSRGLVLTGRRSMQVRSLQELRDVIAN
ncbi:transcriptional regulator [Micromonospora sp. WMMA2032]|uniref:Crp/Fnr family transcriptional regulator n=1 Tax=Micromonospora sp. WMMA2032 TaxID=2039870 RepID=UPI000C058C88|nr:Crp/Fnr family transcriptional regulator [Micromonospora sp. WMMA2032]ATO13223.1 transcriptional regulator [Micromonospora sp. WMMA2032]